MTDAERVYWCRSCRSPRSADEVLEVVRLRDGMTSYVCRPIDGSVCFGRSVRGASEERIALAGRAA